MNFAVTTSNFTYRRLDNGIFEFTLLNNSRAAADEFFDVMDRFHKAVGEGQIAETRTAFLIELCQAGMPNVAYMANRYRTNAALYQQTLPPARVAYIYKSGFVFSMVNALLSVAPHKYEFDQRFFQTNDRPEAVIWLLGKDATLPSRPK
jgi:hypothetical protein